jgi:hypothetical protein
MDLDSAAREWRAHGFVILPGFVPAAELRPALGELPAMYPTADGFHDGTDERRDRFIADEWAGIDHFPFRSAELSLLAVSDRVIDLAQTLLADTDLRVSSAEAWAKYTSAADYDQPMHRDYLNHTLVAPTDDPRFWQLEMFIYAAEVRAAGPAGTVVAWAPGTFHRGTALTLPRGARYTVHLAFRPACAEWGQRTGWGNLSHELDWYRFAHRATPRQLALFGFPPPGHPYWTEATLAATAERYPGLTMTPWRLALGG